MRDFRGRTLSLLVIVALLLPFVPPPPPVQAAAPPPLPTSYTPPTAELAGADRVGTAAAVAAEGWTSSEYVVVATSRTFPDALAGSPLAHALSAPLLLTPPDRLAPAVAGEISRLGATRAVVLGGERAISPAVIDGLVAAGIARDDVERVSGTSRYETAREIAARFEQVAGPATGVVVASGRAYPDALAAAGWAARSGRPIVLTAPDALPDAAREALASIASTDTIIVGGPAAVSEDIAQELPDPVRIGGQDRYETAALIAEYAFRQGVTSYDELLVATGQRFPDALAAGPYAAARGATLVLTRSQSLPPATEAFVRAHTSSTQRIVFLGGSVAISDTVRDAISQAATTRIAEGIRLVDAGTASELVTITAQALLFATETPLLADLEEGQILIGEPSPAAPNGYLRRVLGVTDTGTQISVQTTGVVIEELIEDGSIDVSQHVTPEDIVWDEVLADGVTVEHGAPATAGTFAGALTAQTSQVTYNELKVNLRDISVGAAKLNGSLSIKPSYDFHVRAANFELQEARFTTSVNEKATLTLAGPPLKKEVELYRFRPGSVKFMVGPVPVWVSATFKLFAGVDASGLVDLRVGVEQAVTITSGLQYRSGSWGPVAEFRPGFKVITPTASSDVTAEVYAGAKAELKLYDLAGPYGSVKPLVECAFTIGGDPWWRAKRAVDLTAGFVAEVDVGTSWLKWTWTIAEVSRTWRVAEASLGQSSGPYVPPPGDTDPPGDGDPPDTSIVSFPDANLEAAVRAALDKMTGDITVADMERLEVLDARYSGISDLGGLQYSANLTSLYLGNVTCADVPYNQISDLSPLAGLKNLESLDVARNQVSDISALSGLTNLSSLELHENQISDLSPLSGLTNLSSLDLGWNQISDISPLAGLTNLVDLYLGYNRVSDISTLSGLTNLSSLVLHENPISDISVLSELRNLETLVLILNPISDISPLAGLMNLEVLYLGSNQISDISPLSGLTRLTSLHLGYNQISDISPLTGLTNLSSLDLDGNQISDISALSGLRGLVNLYLHRNQISDISALSEKPGLINLDLSSNQISDISTLSGLTSLGFLLLWHNQISDISALVANTGLGADDYIDLRSNNLDLTLDSPAMNNVATLQDRGATVRY